MSRLSGTLAIRRRLHVGHLIRPGTLTALTALTLLAAVLRLATLDVQSYWLDESVTVGLVRGSLGHLLHGVSASESTPPLYYLVAWGWVHLWGAGEVGLRSLSALFGIATVPVVYLAGVQLASKRAGLFAAAIAAVNPLMIYYSQEARCYALLILLCGLSFLLCARVVDRPSGRLYVAWAGVSALALTTHYFAVFLIVPEAAWILERARARRSAVWASAVVGATMLALAPLAVRQRSHGVSNWIENTPITTRIGQVPKQFLVGLDGPAERVTAAGAAILVVYGAWMLLRRGDERERRGAWLAATLGGIAILLPLVLSFIPGAPDVFNGRNVVAASVPVTVAAGIGLAVARGGRGALAAAGGLVALSLALVIVVANQPRYQRDDWRGAVRALGPAPLDGRALVVSDDNAAFPFGVYRPRAHEIGRGEVRVGEIAVVVMASRTPGGPLRVRAPLHSGLPAPGFEKVEEIRHETFAVQLYRAPSAELVGAAALARAADVGSKWTVLREGGTALHPRGQRTAAERAFSA